MGVSWDVSGVTGSPWKVNSKGWALQLLAEQHVIRAAVPGHSAMNAQFPVWWGLPHPSPLCLTCLQVLRIFHMQLQELEVAATRPCDTLGQLLFFWIKGSVTTVDPFLALGKVVELCVYRVVWFIPFLLWQRQAVSHWPLSVVLSMTCRMDRRLLWVHSYRKMDIDWMNQTNFWK